MNVILNESDFDYLNILVVGNGFDLAHKLPTRYADFLEFCIEAMTVHSEFHLPNSYGNKSPMPHISELLSKTSIAESSIENILVDICEHLKNNIWYEYFQEIFQNNYICGEGWIDFENEICFCIKSMDEHTQDLSANVRRYLNPRSESEVLSTRWNLIEQHDKLKYINIYEEEFEKRERIKKTREIEEKIKALEQANQPILKRAIFADVINNAYSDAENYTFRKLRDILFSDLERFTEAFEIYIAQIVEKTKIEEKSPDIEATNARYILSFNYTHTFLDINLYTIPFENRIFIHGDSRNYKKFGSNRNLNIVLGIGEYCDAALKDEHINYIKFKKVFQRLDKQTDEEVEKFFEMCKNKKQMKHFFIFGHSLNETDKDILKVILTMDNSETTIFCNTTGDKESYRENVIKIIGHDMFFAKIKNKTLEFKMQQPMVKLDTPLIYT